MTTTPDRPAPLPLRVMTFGGSSVGAAERLFKATELIARAHALGPVAVVVSAMADTTDRLLAAVDAAAAGEPADPHVDAIEALALGVARDLVGMLDRAGLLRQAPKDLSEEISALMRPLRQLLLGVSLVRERTAQTRDLALSFGERASILVVSALLAARGVPAVAVDARAWTVTDDQFGRANPDLAASRARLHALAAGWDGRVSVHTGFLGSTRDGRTTTLGRNAFVAFTTERHRAYPLLVQGAGAGGAVTAAGVLTDILKIALSLRGR